MTGQTILVTRPIGEVAETLRFLAAEGFAAIVSPVLEIRHLDPPLPADSFAGLLATSVNGLHGLVRLGADRFRSLPLFVVGETTAATAMRLGFATPSIVAPDAGSLSDQLVDFSPRPATLLYAAGRDRTTVLERRLAVAGISLTVAEVYAAEPVRTLTEEARHALISGTVTAVLHMSRRSAEAFVAAAEASGLSVPVLGVLHVAISAKAAEPLRPRGAARVTIADRPTLAASIARLRVETRLGYATHSRETRLEE